MEQFYASAYVLLELMSREVKTQIAGITIVGDISGFSFKHIRNLGIEQLRQDRRAGVREMCFQDDCGLPDWGIPSLGSQDPRRQSPQVEHSLGTDEEYFRIFNILFNMMRPILDDRVRDNITFHG